VTGFLLEGGSKFVCLYIELSFKGEIPKICSAIFDPSHVAKRVKDELEKSDKLLG
jgi:hypothetical protein